MKKIAAFIGLFSLALAGAPLTRAAIKSPPASIPFFSGQQAPNLPAGVLFDSFGPAVVNNRGQVAFLAVLSGSAVTLSDNLAVYLGTPASVHLVARSGEVAPGLGGPTIGDIGQVLQLDDSGNVYFVSHLEGAVNATDGVLWTGTAGGYTKLAREGDSVPGTGLSINATTFYDTSAVAPPWAGDGKALFLAGLTSGNVANDDALLLATTGTLALVAREGDPAPGTGSAFASLTPATPGTTFDVGGITEGGFLAFASQLSGTDTTTLNPRGLWAGFTGDIALRLRAGTSFPGSSTRFFSTFGTPAINSAEGLAFLATAQDSAGTAIPAQTGIWVSKGSKFRRVVRQGKRISRGSDVRYLAFGDPLLNRRKEFSFYSLLQGPGVDTDNDVAIAAGKSKPKIVAREGTRAPGFQGTVRCGDLNLSDLQVNGERQKVLLLPLSGKDILANENDSAVVTTDPDGNEFKVAQAGDTMVVNGTDRIADTFSFPGALAYGGSIVRPGGGSDGRQRLLNDYGRVVVAIAFLGLNSGVMIADLPANVRVQPDVQVRFNPGILQWEAVDAYKTLPITDPLVDYVDESGIIQTYRFRIQNDGNIDDIFEVKGFGGNQNVEVKYFADVGDVDITAAVKGGTYKTPSIAPGEYFEMYTVVTPGFGAQGNDSFNLVVRARSKTDRTKRDEARVGYVIPP